MLPNLNANILNLDVDLSESDLQTLLNVAVLISQMLHVQMVTNDDCYYSL